jgi:hypothetical protein
VKGKKHPYSRTGFQLGSEGVCEAQLWKFSAPQNPYNPEEEPESHMVAAQSIYEALKYIRRTERDFRISKAECIGMIAMLSGSPLD